MVNIIPNTSQYKIIIDWHFKAEYSREHIKKIFERALSRGYSLFTYKDDTNFVRKNLSLEQALICAYDTYINETRIEYVFAEKNDRALSFTFTSDEKQLGVSTGFISYLYPFDEFFEKFKGFNNAGDWYQIGKDLHQYHEILAIFPIVKCRFQQEHYIEEPAHELGKNVPAISVFSSLMLRYPDDRALFLQDLIERGYEISDENGVGTINPEMAKQSEEQTYIIARDGISGKLIIRPDEGDYWFAPIEPFNMRQYQNEYAIDTAAYIEFTFDMCPVPIYILETEGFEDIDRR